MFFPVFKVSSWLIELFKVSSCGGVAPRSATVFLIVSVTKNIQAHNRKHPEYSADNNAAC
jgi:hypothetical protein